MMSELQRVGGACSCPDFDPACPVHGYATSDAPTLTQRVTPDEVAAMWAAEPTLTDFLLARIAEDEAQIRDGRAGIIALSLATRVLAECEAKRRIVERHGGEWPECVASTIDACPELRDLASAYADHPDYREEWKP